LSDHNDIVSIVIDRRKSGGVGAGPSDADAERASLAGIDIKLTDDFATLGLTVTYVDARTAGPPRQAWGLPQ
jgi:hypothetical protein